MHITTCTRVWGHIRRKMTLSQSCRGFRQAPSAPSPPAVCPQLSLSSLLSQMGFKCSLGSTALLQGTKALSHSDPPQCNSSSRAGAAQTQPSRGHPLPLTVHAPFQSSFQESSLPPARQCHKRTRILTDLFLPKAMKLQALS